MERGPALIDGLYTIDELIALAKRLALGVQDGDFTHAGNQILSQTPEDPDGTWPARARREIIETARSQDIEQGIDMASLNGRGITWRGMDTGG